jgi:hypothetical protein
MIRNTAYPVIAAATAPVTTTAAVMLRGRTSGASLRASSSAGATVVFATPAFFAGVADADRVGLADPVLTGAALTGAAALAALACGLAFALAGGVF